MRQLVQNLEHSNVWELVKNKLLEMKQKSLEGLQQPSNSREEDVQYKARIAVIKELLDMPRVLATVDAAKQKRTNGQRSD